MTVRKYVYDEKLGKMVEMGERKVQERTGPYIIGDIKPYQVTGPEYGKWITSRSQHRDYLRTHNLVEVGNEKDYITGKKK